MRPIDADELKKHFPKDENWDYPVNANSEVVKIIDNAPTVKTINHGRWIKVEDDYNNHLYECSYCHTWTSLPIEEVNDGNIRYCWSCGAKMDR